jgi:hypothetical protein
MRCELSFALAGLGRVLRRTHDLRSRLHSYAALRLEACECFSGLS